MKNIFAIFILSLVILSCNEVPEEGAQEMDTTSTASSTPQVKDEPENQPNSTVTGALIAEEPELERISYGDSVNFEKYPASPRKRQSNAPINWASYPDAKMFKTRIIDAYRENEVGFAGHYVLSVFGCGASCIMGFMVDVRDGEIYDLPLGEENSCLFAEDRVLCERTSNLFISGVCKENVDAKKVFYTAFLWDEENKKFNPIEEKEFLK